MTMPTCDMRHDCDEPVTYVDEKGYVYCTGHGQQRQQSRRCRKMRPFELRRIERGEVITRY